MPTGAIFAAFLISFFKQDLVLKCCFNTTLFSNSTMHILHSVDLGELGVMKPSDLSLSKMLMARERAEDWNDISFL